MQSSFTSFVITLLETKEEHRDMISLFISHILLWKKTLLCLSACISEGMCSMYTDAPPLFVLPPTPPPPNRACSLEKRCVYSMGKQYSKEEEAATAENRPRLGPPAGSKEKILGGQQKCIFFVAHSLAARFLPRKSHKKNLTPLSGNFFKKPERGEVGDLSREKMGGRVRRREREKVLAAGCLFWECGSGLLRAGQNKKGRGQKKSSAEF